MDKLTLIIKKLVFQEFQVGFSMWAPVLLDMDLAIIKYNKNRASMAVKPY
ncbi:MAG: hypothetical protein P8X74_14000 [Reinekea sp.]